MADATASAPAPPRGPHAAAGAGDSPPAADDRRLAGEFYALYAATRLMLVREFEDKGLARAEAVASAQAFLNRLMLALFAGGPGRAGAERAADGIAGVLEGGIGEGTRRVWDYIVGDLFAAPPGGQAHAGAAAPGGGLFGEPIHASAFFPDKRGEEFFGAPDARRQRRPAPPEYCPRIAGAVHAAPGLSPAIECVLRLCSHDIGGRIGADMLGRVFESSVTDLEALLGRRAAARRRDGIFYTPTYVVDYICSRSISGYLSPSGRARDPAGLVAECAGGLDDLEGRMRRMSILDPACGSGAFLTGAARVMIGIREEIGRRRDRDGEPSRRVGAGDIFGMVRGSIYGIDINPQSADIARLSLHLLAAEAEGPHAGGEGTADLSANVVVGNGALAGPDRGGLDWEKAFPAVFACENPGFSVVVGNPPYVRHELLGDAAKRAMAALPDGLAPPAPRGGARQTTLVPDAGPPGGPAPPLPRTRILIPRKSDLGAYFYYHSLCRLRRGGRLGFISADNWLRAEYGRPLRLALLSNAEIEALVSARFKVFPDADVNTVIALLARRPPAPAGRIVFANAASALDLAEDSLDVAARVSPPDLGGGDWSPYFDKPVPEPEFPTAALGSAGRLRRGIATGRNDFFVLPRDGAWARRLPSSCLRPVVGSGAPPRLEDGGAARYVFDAAGGNGAPSGAAPSRPAAEYIEHGEAMTVAPKKGGGSGRAWLPDLPTLAGRRPWYSLPFQPPPPIFIGRIVDRTVRVHENAPASGGTGRAYVALDTHHCFTPREAAHAGAFLAYFASSYFALDMEKSAAPLGGGGLRIDNRVLAGARVPAFGRLSPDAVRAMEGAWSEYCESLDRERLDAAVFAALGMEGHLEAVRAELDRLVERRRRASRREPGGT